MADTVTPLEEPVATPLAAPSGFGDLQETLAQQGTRFSGPVLTGAPDLGGAGIALYCRRGRITAAGNGSFNIPVYLGPGAIVFRLTTVAEVAYNGTAPTVELDQTSGGTLMMAATVSLKGATPVLDTVVNQITQNGQVWLKVVHDASTLGSAIIIIHYSLPGKAVPS